VGLSKEELAEVAITAARATVEAMQERERHATERIYGIKVIAAECGVSEDTFARWVAKHGFPLDKDPRGYSVRRWNLERWFEARRRCVSMLKR
jgi:hypothetical protein